MKKILFLLVIIICSYSCQTKSTTIQETTIVKKFDVTYLKSKSAHFTVEGGALAGKGKEMLEQLIATSQFVVFGEYHYSKQTSHLMTALAPMLHKSKFEHFIAEVGPNSAEKLMELSTPHTATEDNLRSFITKYKHKALGETADPIPFFAGVEDAEFLAAFRKHKMKVYGIDQEYFFAILFLTDELLKEAKDKPNYTSIAKLKKEIDAIVFRYLKEEEEEKIESALALLLKDKKVLEFFNQFDVNDTKAMKIIEDLKLSWDIYIRWRKGSHADRISYMRNNLLKIHKTNPASKMFIKLGSLHTSKIISNGAYDIGNQTEELAQERGTISTSINSWRPFFQEKDSVINYLEKYKNYYKKYDVFFELAQQNEWTIIDLKSIRNDIKNKKVALPTNGKYHALKELIEGYDYQLILPIDESITYNINQ